MIDRVYRLGPLDGYELVQPINSADYETLAELIDGTPRGESWRPIEVALIRTDNGGRRLYSDCPWLASGTLVLREGAAQQLAGVLGAHAEFLPLACRDASLVLVNVTTLIDALDRQSSSLVQFSDGRLMAARHFEFVPEAIHGADVFKLPDFRVSDIFVGKRFVDEWHAAELDGLALEPVWQLRSA